MNVHETTQPPEENKVKPNFTFLLALVVNVVALVWFVASSQANQDVRIEAHEQRIVVNERLLSTAMAERIAVGQLQVQMASVQTELAEIKRLLQERQQ